MGITAAALELTELAQKHPHLTYAGYGDMGIRICGMETPAKWQKSREAIFLPEFFRQVEMARAFIRGCCTQTTKINKKRTSYGYKHDVEHWLRENPEENIGEGGNGYVSNGAFIAAALIEGYRISGTGNVHINLRVLK